MLRKIVQGLALVGVVFGVGAVGSGCLDRPVTAAEPTIKTNFTNAVNQSGINKVDILFDIDNSASMGDKQAYLVQAIPQMIARLVTPRCVDSKGAPVGGNADPSTGMCAMGAPEFTAVHDMHIGVVTSSLGSRLGVQANGTGGGANAMVCDPAATAKTQGGMSVSAYNDDKGRLINRTQTFGVGPALANAADGTTGGGFLYWYPALGNGVTPAATPPAGHYTTSGVVAGGAMPAPGTLVGDFTELVQGAGESGCGIESQLESWYRFLIQPDPYLQLGLDASGAAQWQGVDTTILQQRHDFLRPDSLVAVIVLTDENDSEIDVRSYQGSGYKFMSLTYNPPRSTTQCTTMGPGSPLCQTCGGPGTATDPNCTMNGGVYSSATANDWGYNLNLRHVHMQEKYALNPQFPLTRYYNGLTSLKVPNRVGEYPSVMSGYSGTNNCSNPLFAGTLPQAKDVADSTAITPTEISTTLCTLTGQSVRQPADVFYAHIGGVPHELLQNDAAMCTSLGCTGGSGDAPSCATVCAQKDALATTDWQKILGRGAAGGATADGGTTAPGAISFDYTGIDPHMIEAQSPRNALMNPPASNPAVTSLVGPALGSGADPVRPDPINGREWTTNTGTHSLPVDREYACIFKLPAAQQRDCSTYSASSIEGNSCDCVPGGAWNTGGMPAVTGNTPDQIPPLCSKTSTDGSITSSVNDYTVQTHAKAYPTIRELTLANMMGTQGIVSSLCPIHTEDNATGDDPLYGYRPAVNAIVNRLKSALQPTCVQKLTTDSKGDAPCLVLVSFKPGSTGAPPSASTCSMLSGYSTPDPGVLMEFNQTQHAAAGDGGASVDLSTFYTCQLAQVPVPPGQTCVVANGPPGWCYVTGAGISSGSSCTQQIVYSSTGLVPNGAVINLQCVSGSGGGTDAAVIAPAVDGH